MNFNSYNIVKNEYADEYDLEKKLNERIMQLEKELQYANECLLRSIEEGEVSRENLKYANEELQVYNEEFQTANEELKSVNEELLEINTQYQSKNQELADLYNDMTNYLNSTDIGTIFIDKNLCVRKFTPSVTKIINLKPQDIGRPMHHISNNFINDELNIGAREVMNSHMSYEKEIQSKDGNWYLFKCNPYRTSELSIKGVVLSLVDITQRKCAEIETARLKERYEKLVEYSPYAIYIIENGKFYFSNSAGLKLLNIKDMNELMLMDYGYYFNIDEEDLINNGANNTQLKGKTIPLKEDRIILPDGTELLVEISAMSLLFDGKESKLLLVRDISFLIIEKHLKEENEKNKKLLDEKILSETLKSEFFSNLSHELRTPINVILSAVQLWDKFTGGNNVNDKERNFKKYINIMKQNCLRQLRLVNNMIDITKLDTGFFELNLQNCNIVNVVEDVTMSVAEYIKNNSINLIFDTDIEECIISCDPEKIERVMLNILANSVKFTKSDGNITVNIYDKGENIIISIKDTGIGIPKDKLDIIFDRFRQVDKSLTRNHEGSGIGLSIVKSLVEMHGGIISVLSEYGKGTEFIIELPVIVMSIENEIRGITESESEDRIDRIHIEFSDIYSLN